MESGLARVLPVGRHLALDDRGVGLRATWRLEQGFVNLSLWRDDTCVETFHLTPAAAADLIAFPSHGLAEATASAAGPARRVSMRRGPPSRRPEPPPTTGS